MDDLRSVAADPRYGIERAHPTRPGSSTQLSLSPRTQPARYPRGAPDSLARARDQAPLRIWDACDPALAAEELDAAAETR